MAATDLGIPEEDVLIFEGNSRSTQDEALTIREYIKNNREIESIILVTSKYHSRRAKQIFKKALSVLDREMTSILALANMTLLMLINGGRIEKILSGWYWSI